MLQAKERGLLLKTERLRPISMRLAENNPVTVLSILLIHVRVWSVFDWLLKWGEVWIKFEYSVAGFPLAFEGSSRG